MTQLKKNSLLDLNLQQNTPFSEAWALQKAAAKVGFDWPDYLPVVDKIEEELYELLEAIKSDNTTHVKEEYGDLLFAVLNLGRHINILPEEALQSCNDKFKKRFRYIEQVLGQQGKSITNSNLDEMEALWIEAKNSQKI